MKTFLATTYHPYLLSLYIGHGIHNNYIVVSVIGSQLELSMRTVDAHWTGEIVIRSPWPNVGLTDRRWSEPEPSSAEETFEERNGIVDRHYFRLGSLNRTPINVGWIWEDLKLY